MLLQIPYLEGFLDRTIHGLPAADHWATDNTLLAGLRLGLQDTFAYLHRSKPSLGQFERWILDRNGGAVEPERIARINAALSGELQSPAAPDPPVLNADDLRFWNEKGYVVLRNAVSPEDAASAAAAIYECLGARPDLPESWYIESSLLDGIWVSPPPHPALLQNRNSTRIHAAFAQLWRRADLWVNTDQCGFNPPERPNWEFKGQRMHFDVSLALPILAGTQALLYLTDTPAHQGAFRCVPGFHHEITDWLLNLPSDLNPRDVDFSARAVLVPGNAGDMVIWHQALPHGASPNRGRYPRLVQYLNLRPSTWEYNNEWK